MRSILAALALGASTLSAVAAAQADAQPYTVKWSPLYEDEEGQILFDPASVRRDGETVLLKIRAITDPSRSSFASANLDWKIDCAGQTTSLLGGEIYDAEGNLLRSARLEPEQVETEPLYADSEEAVMYTRFCPGTKPLLAPPSMPAIIATTPGTGPGCKPCDKATKPEEE